MTAPITPLQAGAPLPDLTLDGPTGDLRLHHEASLGPLVIAFYAQDATPTCAAQLCAFRDDFDLIARAGAQLLAISADDRTSRGRFQAAQSFPFPLCCDPQLHAAEAFGVVDPSGARSLRAVFVSGPSLRIERAIPHYNPANTDQFLAVFEAIGLDLG